jgi:hypothetical protein
MRMTRHRRAIRRAAAGLLGALAVLSTGCMQYAPDGSVATPAPPGQSDSSRLPQLLSQLQGASGAGVEVFDGQNEVLAAQDAPGQSPTPTPLAGKDAPGATSTVAGEKTPNPGAATTTPTRSPTPAATARPSSEGQSPTPAPTATPTTAATPAPTAAPSPTPSPTPTPVLPQSEAGQTPTAAPPSEG